MAEELVESLPELQKAEVADRILPGIFVFLDKLLSREHISDELEGIRQSYVAILRCTNTESPQVVRKNVDTLAESLKYDHETSKSGKFGRIREKRLINIRQFHLKQNQRKQERKNKMDTNDDSRLVTHTDDECRLIPKSGKKTRAVTDKDEVSGHVNLATDDESRYHTTTDDERRISTGGESFVELSKSQCDITSQKYLKFAEANVNKGHLYHKESDGLRQRWFTLDGSVLKCYKRQNQNLLFEVNFSGGAYSAIQGRIGRMFAIRLSGTSSHLFASPKAETIASWVMALSKAGVRLQDDILREVSMNQQNNNNNKVRWSLDGKNFPEKDEFRSELLEALEFIERNRGPCILPKRSSHSFKELDVLKKLKSSLVAKKAEGKLNRRKTWSAGSFPITNLAMLERFRKPTSGSDGNFLDVKKEKDDIVKELASKSLPEILTSNGVVPSRKEDKELEKSSDNADQSVVTSEEELCCTKSLPEGLNKQADSDVIEVSKTPRGSINAQSVPDLLIHPCQESITDHQSCSPKMQRHLKPSISLTRVMSLKASLMKNAIISGWKRKGRRGSGLIALDPELSDIHGCLFRKKGQHWKLRWCSVSGEIFYVFRDSQYSQEDMRCSLRKCSVVSSCQEPGRDHCFKLIRRKGEEILLAAEDGGELERWLAVFHRETLNNHLSQGNDSRSSSLTVSLFGSDNLGDSSAAEDTPPEIRNSNYCETTDKDSSDEHSTTSSGISAKVRSRGLHEKGYVYFLLKQDTWEHCWMEVSFGVLSIYNDETKETALQRDHVALCDIRHDSTNTQRPYSFVLKKASRHPIYFAVDSEHDFLKWQKCFNSWRKTASPEEKAELKTRLSNDDVMPSNPNFLTIPRSPPICDTPVTSDSDCCGEGHDPKTSELAERPKVRRSMTDVLSQITPKLKRRSQSSAGSLEAGNDVHKNAVKSSFLYYKANSGLWVKYWCVLDSAVIYCFNSPEDGEASFSVGIHGSEIRRTSCKSKNFTFDVFHRAADQHHEFAGDSTYLMYAWMRVLKIAAGRGGAKNSNSDELPVSKSEEPGTENELSEAKKTRDEILDKKPDVQDLTPIPLENIPTSRTSLSTPTSPKKKPKMTSLDEVLKLLHEKQLQQELLTKQLTKSERARIRWQHSMLVILRRTRNMRKQSSSENLKSSGSFGAASANGMVSSELDKKAAKVKYNEISAKYDSILEDERLKMLRRETLLKKRRNSLILRQDILQKKLNKAQDTGKGTLKKRQSKSDAKEMSASFTKGENEEVIKQLAEINVELEGIKQDITSNHEEQRRVSADLNEQKHKELHEIRVNVDLSPQTSKSSIHETKSLHRRQVSDSSLADNCRQLSINDNNTLKLPLTHTMSTPAGDIRTKAKSFSSSSSFANSKTKSSPLLRTKTYDSTDGSKRPKMKSRTSQETLSLALSQIEDFEAFAQDSFRNCGADVGC